MTIRIVSRLILLLAGLAAVTALFVGVLSLLASTTAAQAAPLLERDQAAAVERAIEAPVKEAPADADASSTPTVVLVFAGIVLLATLPPAHRVYVYHRSHYRSDWL